MPWVRIDDHFDEHLKHAAAGPLCWALWVAGLAYCNRNLTDGFIPSSTVPRLVNWKYLEPPGPDGRRRLVTIGVTSGAQGDDVTSEYVAGLLVAHGIWEERDGGYYVHDFPDYQPSKKEVIRSRKQTQERTRLGGLARARTGKRKEGRYVKSQQSHQQDSQQPCWPSAGPVLVGAHQQKSQQQSHLITSPVPVPVYRTEKAQSPSVVSPPNPDGPAGGHQDGGSQTGSDNHRGQTKSKALRVVLTDEQAARAKSICIAITSLPAKPKSFQPWAFLQRSVSAGLPVDDALKILRGIKDRWPKIAEVWAYAQDVLRREYQQHHIELALEAHEQRKREPTRLGAILAEAQQRGTRILSTDPEHPP